MKNLIYILSLLLCSFSASAQFGTITFNQDTVIIMRRLKLLSIRDGATSDSLITHKVNGNIGRLHMNQLIVPYANLTGTPNLSLYYLASNPSGYLSSITSSNVTTALGFTPYNASNPSGYISSVPAQSFSSLTGKPTTLSGYGITDAYPLSGNPSAFLTGINSAQVTSALGFTPYNATNPNGYISSYTETDPTVPAYSKTLSAFSVIKSSTDPLYRPISYVPAFSDLTSKPTTISGYGITDAVSTARGSISLTTTGTGASTYSSSTGVLNIPSPKRQETYTGVTATSGSVGTYTVTFATAYSVTPNVQVAMVDGTAQNSYKVSRTTTGFTVTTYTVNNVLGLLPTYPATGGITVDVLVTSN